MITTVTTIFNGHPLTVEIGYEPGEPRTFDDEGSDEELEIMRVWYQGIEVTGLIGEDMLDKLHAKLLSEKGCNDD
jgi:hypothetical protein